MKVKTKTRQRKPVVSYSLTLSRYEAEVLFDVLHRHVTTGGSPTLEKLRQSLADNLIVDESGHQVWPETRLDNQNAYGTSGGYTYPFATVREKKFSERNKLDD